MIINKILRVEDLVSLSTDMLIEAYKNGYKIEEYSLDRNSNNDNHKNWKPLTDKQLYEIRKIVNMKK